MHLRPTALLALAAAAAAFQPLPTSLRARRSPLALRAEPSNKFAEGEFCVAQDEHGVWYEAQVLEVAATETGLERYRVHYAGWGVEHDEWRLANSLGKQGARDRKPGLEEELSTWMNQGGSAIGGLSDEEDEQRMTSAMAADNVAGLSEDEILDIVRERRQRSNDCWQFDTFVKEHSGTMQGVCTEYAYDAAAQTLEQVDEYARSTTVARDDDTDAASEAGPADQCWAVTVSADSDGAAGAAGARLRPGNFRGDAPDATMVNGNAFTSARCAPGGTALSVEVWLRYAEIGVALAVSYAAAAPGGTLVLDRVALTRARLDRPPTKRERGLFGPDGTGLYDPAAAAATDCVAFAAPGFVSAAFPSSLAPEGGRAAVVLDWAPGQLRYQAERIFEKPDGSLASFEVLEVTNPDAPEPRGAEEE